MHESRKFKFTEAAIKRLPRNPPKQVDYWDTLLPAFGIRITPKGRYAWTLATRVLREGKWKPTRICIGYFEGGSPKLNLADARAKARETFELCRAGKDPVAEKARNRETAEHASLNTFKAVRERFIDHLKTQGRRPRTVDEYQRVLEGNDFKAWETRSVSDIARREVKDLLKEVAGRDAPIMANRTLAYLRAMLNYAVEEEEIIDTNPAWRVKLPAPETPRERVLAEKEIKAFWAKIERARMDPATRLALKLILVTGQRPGEVAGMEWSEIDDRWWTIPNERTKNRLVHRVPLSPLALALIAAAKTFAGRSGYVFPSPRNTDAFITEQSLARAVGNNREAFGIEHFTPHDLRRTCGTMLGKIGASRFIQDRLLNHKDRSMGGVYDRHSYDKEKRQALNAWAKKLERLTGAAPARKRAKKAAAQP